MSNNATTTTPTMTPVTPDYASVKPPLSQRFNLRILIFAGVVLFLLGWPVYTFLSETLTHGVHDRGSYKEVDLKALGNFDFDKESGKVTDVPAAYRALDGQKVLLTGEIYAPHEAGPNVSEFELVYSIQKCCFNGPPRVQERVFSTVKKGKKVDYRGEGYHKVLGTLHVTMKQDKLPSGEAGPIVEVYHLDVDSIEPG
jgi:hypothetical protein